MEITRKNAPSEFYHYKGVILRVVDADTIQIMAELGFESYFKHKFRLARINAPETRGPERPLGLKAKAFVRQYIKDNGSLCILSSHKHGKYRWIAEIWINGINLNDLLVRSGHAVYHKY